MPLCVLSVINRAKHHQAKGTKSNGKTYNMAVANVADIVIFDTIGMGKEGRKELVYSI